MIIMLLSLRPPYWRGFQGANGEIVPKLWINTVPGPQSQCGSGIPGDEVARDVRLNRPTSQS
jgi:hypothetical protein